MNNLLTTVANWAQIVALPIAIVAIAVTIWIYFRSKQRRALSCTFDPLISPIEIKAGDALKGDIEIRYRGQSVANLFIARATLKNTGNLPIRKTDIVEPLTFTFGSGIELIRKPHASNMRPHNLKIAWNFSMSGTPAKVNVAQLEFDLLNPGDGLVVEFICTGTSSLPTLTARIEGVTEIGLLDSQEVHLLNDIKSATIFMLGFFSIVMVIFLVFPASNSSDSFLALTLPIALLTALFAQVTPSLIKLRNYRKHKSNA
jgi:hypothetical protein